MLDFVGNVRDLGFFKGEILTVLGFDLQHYI